ncbi:molybdopterin-dependent oxidoreductase [Alcanivorax sp. DP30]|uniref:molybdopterin-containing oxidoreductase family protein n=1 Tax=Alcanivorax sp. DP30 TaxID=2606217 RepID=UPI00136D45AB|nr:molybdopterin-dependent oxidoreductase [Alcanivorax sp. DP30]MZR62199.1 molybdopterin-dependent oxidoreductase [Alcanivorax sp. DP30]
MKTIPTFCRVCEPSCALVAQVEDGKVQRLQPDKDHPVTRGFACHKGVNYLAIHQDPDRLDAPQVRKGSRQPGEGEWQTLDWDNATADVAAALNRIREQHGDDAVAGYIGNPTAFNALGSQAIGEFFMSLGSRRVFNSGTQDCANKFAGGEAVFGTSTLHPLPDFDHTDCLLIFGENPKVSHMSFISIADPMAKIRAACQRGASVYYINPRRIESASPRTGEVIQILPDTDLYLMAALLHEIDVLGRFDEEVLHEHGKHVRELRDFIAPYSADAVAEVVGLPAQQIRALADEFSGAERASVHMSTGVNMGRHGTLCYWLLQMLSFVTGNLDKKGGNFYSEGFYPAAKAGRVRSDKVFFNSNYGEMRLIRGALPGNLLPDLILDDDNPIRALVVIAGNPLLSVGGEARWRQALEKLELLVVIDLFRNATGEYAHYLLPSADMLERPDLNICGLGMQYQPYVQYTDAVVSPAAERKEEWWILSRLLQQMGMPSSLLDQPGNPFGRLEHMMSRHNLTVDSLKAAPSGTAVLNTQSIGRFFDDFLQTDDKRVDCCPPLFSESMALANHQFTEIKNAAPAFRLINLRTNYMHNSWYQNVPKLKRGKHDHNPLHMSPEDMAALGLNDGDSLTVSNQYGEVKAQARADDTLRPGVVAMTHGWGNQKTPGMTVANRYPGVNINALLPNGPGSYEKLSNQAFMSGVPVDIRT